MAIQVGGTTVIDNSRNLQNVQGIKTIGGNSILGSGDIAVGGSAPSWSPTLTPDVTYTSSSTWTKPASVGSDDWVVFYMVGGGGAGSTGSWATGGNGASATIFSAKGSSLPSSITFTIGSGAAGGVTTEGAAKGGDTTATINSRIYRALGGSGASGNSSNYTSQMNTVIQPNGSFTVPFDGTSPNDYDGAATKGGQGSKGGSGTTYCSADRFIEANAILGAAGGCGAVISSTVANGGVSTYAGNGGQANNTSVAGNTGSVPGGGGGGSQNNSYAGAGGSGSVRIYYV